MTIRQASFLGLEQQYPQEDGVTTFATERVPCIWAVSRISFNFLFSTLWPPFLLGPNSPYFDVHPTLDSLLFFPLSHAHLSAGLAIGGAWGVREGASRPLAVSNTRLRINSVLNSVTRRGTFIGNSAGVAGKHFFFKGKYTSMMWLQLLCIMGLILLLTLWEESTTLWEASLLAHWQARSSNPQVFASHCFRI